MRIQNQKGFTGLEIAGVGALLFILATVVLPLVGVRLPGTSSGQTTTQKSSYRETMEPVLLDGRPAQVKLPDGSDALLFKRSVSNDASDQHVVPQAPLFERIVLWFVRLGFAGLALALAFPTVFIGITVFIQKRFAALVAAINLHKADLTDLRTEAQRIVLSVDDALKAVDAKIVAADSAMASAVRMAAEAVEPAAKAAAQQLVHTYQAVAKALLDAKNSALAAMSHKQDGSTKALVSELKNAKAAPPPA